MRVLSTDSEEVSEKLTPVTEIVKEQDEASDFVDFWVSYKKLDHLIDSEQLSVMLRRFMLLVSDSTEYGFRLLHFKKTDKPKFIRDLFFAMAPEYGLFKKAYAQEMSDFINLLNEVVLKDIEFLKLNDLPSGIQIPSFADYFRGQKPRGVSMKILAINTKTEEELAKEEKAIRRTFGPKKDREKSYKVFRKSSSLKDTFSPSNYDRGAEYALDDIESISIEDARSIVPAIFFNPPPYWTPEFSGMTQEQYEYEKSYWEGFNDVLDEYEASEKTTSGDYNLHHKDITETHKLRSLPYKPSTHDEGQLEQFKTKNRYMGSKKSKACEIEAGDFIIAVLGVLKPWSEISLEELELLEKVAPNYGVELETTQPRVPVEASEGEAPSIAPNQSLQGKDRDMTRVMPHDYPVGLTSPNGVYTGRKQMKVKANSDLELEADELRNGKWAVRPKGTLGTMGWSPYPWAVRYVKARTGEEAVKKVRNIFEEEYKSYLEREGKKSKASRKATSFTYEHADDPFTQIEPNVGRNKMNRPDVYGDTRHRFPYNPTGTRIKRQEGFFERESYSRPSFVAAEGDTNIEAGAVSRSYNEPIETKARKVKSSEEGLIYEIWKCSITESEEEGYYEVVDAKRTLHSIDTSITSTKSAILNYVISALGLPNRINLWLQGKVGDEDLFINDSSLNDVCVVELHLQKAEY